MVAPTQAAAMAADAGDSPTAARAASNPRTARRVGREIALQVLYALDMQPDLGVEQAIAHYYQTLAPHADDSASSTEAPLAGDEEREARRFAEGLVRGARGECDSIDQLISQSSRNWRLERMTWVDRNLLRLATFELRDTQDIPARVAINEAIELAKRFGTTESAAFVNGVLDRVLSVLGRRGEGRGSPPPRR